MKDLEEVRVKMQAVIKKTEQCYPDFKKKKRQGDENLEEIVDGKQ